MGLETLRHIHSKFSRADSRNRVFQLYQSLGDRIRLQYQGSAAAQNQPSQIIYSHKSGSPGKTLLEMCDFIFLSEILSVYCEGIEPAAPKLTWDRHFMSGAGHV